MTMADSGRIFAADQLVASLYRGILGRAPDDGGLISHVRLLEQGMPLADIVRQFVICPEFLAKRVAVIGAAVDALEASSANPIQLAMDEPERELLWQHVAREWTQLGRQDPYFSVLTGEEYRRENLSPDAIARFYDSGRWDLQRCEHYLARHGLRLPQDGVCVDYGCGLGRATLWLAQRCKRVLAVDISEAHLAMAREALAQRGIDNVEFHLLRQRADLAVLDRADFFHSVIVLQHNPPPIILDILERAFAGLNHGGSAFFQVPTYLKGYRWNLDEYVAGNLPRGSIEMHVLPQSAVFAAALQHRCLPVEVEPDHCTGLPNCISNTFVFVKPERPSPMAGHCAVQ